MNNRHMFGYSKVKAALIQTQCKNAIIESHSTRETEAKSAVSFSLPYRNAATKVCLPAMRMNNALTFTKLGHLF